MMVSSFGKCYMRVEMITFIFGLFTVMTSLVTIITSTVALFAGAPFISLMLIPEPYTYRHMGIHVNLDVVRPTLIDWDRVVIFTDIVGPPVFIALGIIALIFSALLVAGVQKKNAAFVKAYYIYGLITLPASCLLFIILTFVSEDSLQYIFSHIGILFVLAMHGVMLIYVRKTYQKFDSGDSKQYSHKRLNEKNDNEIDIVEKKIAL
uniref:Uncharacterized protein n=1 Tax=Pectinophora gossypiella TaxID=13191 RepID=A0A1E1WNG1_PECGO